MSADGSKDQGEGDARAKAFEQAYKESHPDGPYPAVEVKPKEHDSRRSK